MSLKKIKAPRVGKSAPAVKPHHPAVTRFADFAVQEEQTTQKSVDLKKIKIESEQDIKIAQAQSKAAVRMNHDRLCANLSLEIKKLQLEHDFQLKTRLAEISAQHQNFSDVASSSQSQSSNFSPSSFANPGSMDWESWSTTDQSGDPEAQQPEMPNGYSFLEDLNSDTINFVKQ